MNQCSSCSRDITGTASVCDECAEWASKVASVQTPQESTEPEYTEPEYREPEYTAPGYTESIPPSVETPVVAPPRKPVSRSMILLLVAVGIGLMGLGLLSAGRSTVATPVTDTAPTAVPSANKTGRATAVGTQKWSTRNSAYWVGNRRKSFAFELPAENTVSVWMRSVRPALVVRCMGRRTEVFVVTESALKIEPQSEDHTITFAFDGQANVSERWPDSEEHDAVFARDGAEFAHRLLGARTLRFGYTPHNAEPVVAQFSVAGLSEHIAPAARECGWK